MRAQHLVSVMGIMASVAIVGIVIGSDNGEESANRTGPDLVSYAKQDLNIFPRDPLPLTRPQTWIVSDDYPTMAVRDEIDGIVQIRVSVDIWGEVSDCKILQSSKVVAFDKRACSAISTRARFKPALDADQAPVPGTYETTIVWRLNE